MTVEVKEEFTVTHKRKEHPNDRKYPGRPSMEFGTAVTKFLSDLDKQEFEDFSKGELVFEEEVSAEFFDSILVGDVVGLGVLKGFDESPCAYKWKILEVDTEADTIRARNCTWEDEKKHPDYKGDEAVITFEEFSCGMGMGFGEILERDGKPFGVSEEIEQVIKIYGEADGDDSSSPLAGALAEAADQKKEGEEPDTADNDEKA